MKYNEVLQEDELRKGEVFKFVTLAAKAILTSLEKITGTTIQNKTNINMFSDDGLAVLNDTDPIHGFEPSKKDKSLHGVVRLRRFLVNVLGGKIPERKIKDRRNEAYYKQEENIRNYIDDFLKRHNVPNTIKPLQQFAISWEKEANNIFHQYVKNGRIQISIDHKKSMWGGKSNVLLIRFKLLAANQDEKSAAAFDRDAIYRKAIMKFKKSTKIGYVDSIQKEFNLSDSEMARLITKHLKINMPSNSGYRDWILSKIK